jgi:dimethylargininase
MRDGLSIEFTAAITRAPADSCVNGISTANLGTPDPALFRKQHAVYVAALERAGLTVTVLAADERFPDSVFVEDPAFCLPEIAILLSSGAPARQGEAEVIEPAIRSFYGQHTCNMSDGALVDGGDILVTDNEILIGLSNRTNSYGINEITEIVRPWGYTVRPVDTPTGVLHLKTDCATLGGDTVLATRRLAASGIFDGYEVMLVPEGEEAAANAVRINDTVLLAAGFTQTADELSHAGFAIECLDISEARKLDGGLSCMSLRFRSD